MLGVLAGKTASFVPTAAIGAVTVEAVAAADELVVDDLTSPLVADLLLLMADFTKRRWRFSSTVFK